jgi:hypothetical protein
MTTFLILAPYGAFALLMLMTSMATGLFVSAGICLAVIAFDIMRGRSIKLLGAGTSLIFTTLGFYQALSNVPLSNIGVRIAVDGGLLLVGLLSLAVRKPFTLQYAREMTDVETSSLPQFVAANYVITWVWVAAFLLMVAANLLLLNFPELPLWSEFVIALAIRNPALFFSKWYPDRRRRKSGPSSAFASETR